MMPTVSGLLYDGKEEPFANSAQEAGLQSRVANLAPVNRASALVLHMDPVAREVCVAVGSDEPVES